ncbi:LysR family transcriptional regulator substrate-binding protein [Paenibacillus sp. P26]|nr:LysR family transcriptional regulator substrate-binding protein [Paenibacillus sp. P26]
MPIDLPAYPVCAGLFFRNEELGRGRVAITVPPGGVDLMLNFVVGEYHEKYPDVSLSVLGSTDGVDQVLKGDADFGITMSPPPDDRLIAVPLYQDELVVVTAANQPEAQRSRIALEELRHMRMVMLTKDHECRIRADSRCRELGFSLEPHIETTSLTSLLQLVRRGAGATIQSRLPMEKLAAPELAIIPLAMEKPKESVCLIYRKDKFISNAGRSFIRLLNEACRSLSHIRQSPGS